MSELLSPDRRSARLAQSLLELAAALSDDDAEPSRARAAPSGVRDGHAPIVGTTGITEPERLTFTVEEAARLLGVSRAHAYELAARGAIPSLHLGRRILVPKQALVRMMCG
jgi:excisionase family DNA binding protein